MDESGAIINLKQKSKIILSNKKKKAFAKQNTNRE
jgi:hypothetical protein